MRTKRLAFFLLWITSALPVIAQTLLRDAAHQRYLHEHFDEFNQNKKARLMRYYVGYSKPFINIDVNQHYTAPASLPNTTPASGPTDVTVDTKTSGGKSWGVCAGSFFPFVRTGGASAVGFDIGVNGEFFSPSVSPANYGTSVTDIHEDGLAMIINVPMSICYKSGGEVSMSKHDKVLFTIGAGLAPSLTTAKLLAVGEQFNFRKFAMLEFGMFTGIAWKLRATYYPSNFVMVNKTGDQMNSVSKYSGYDPGGSLDVVATGSQDFNISLVLLPFSYKWED